MILPRFYCNTYFVFCYQTIPPIPKNSRSPPLEHEFSSFAKEESLLTSNSGPDSPRNAGAGQVRETMLQFGVCVTVTTILYVALQLTVWQKVGGSPSNWLCDIQMISDI